MCLTITEMKFSYEVLREAGWYIYTGQLSKKIKPNKAFTW